MRRLCLACLCLLAALGCESSTPGPVLINGAGSTFFFPLGSKMFSDYASIDAKVRFNYQSIGSGAGIRQITDRTVDFGASDATLSDEQLAKAPGLLHLPATLGAVAVAYNLPGAPAIKLTPAALAGIFLGQIKAWNDPAIAASNPGVALPTTAVAVVHRSDGSGTSAIFTDYLSKVSPTWASTVHSGTAVRWPVGLGGKGNEGVTGQLTQLPGAIGYVEVAYAMQNHLSIASLQNKSGEFVAPSIPSTTAAAAGYVDAMPDDLRMSLTDSPGKGAYPIVGFTYLLVYTEQTDPVKGPALARFLWWESHEGQKDGPPLTYAPLPDGVVKRVEGKLHKLTLAGKALNPEG
jgi:phosphate transport system substrate-binding protein